jgi:hypothetical protein
MDKNIITEHLYNDTIPQAIKFIENLDDEESLFAYASEYNWDDGFAIPQAILQNKNCSLNVALFIFHAADGTLYLEDKNNAEGTKNWFTFVSNLYNRILKKEFPKGTIPFIPQLSRIQTYKLKKILSEKEMIFITPIEKQ